MSPSRVERLVVVERDRLVGQVARRHHQRPPASASSRWCSGVYGRNTPDQRVARRDRRRASAASGAPRTRARSAARPTSAAAALRRRGSASAAAAAEIADHHRERLLVAVLARAQAPHGVVRRGVAREVEAAEALDRDDQAVAQRLRRRRRSDRRRRDRVPPSAARSVEPRAARRAGVRLRVEAAIADVVVLALARRAHRERAPSSSRARSYGTSRGDGEARAAVRAVGERVAVAAVGADRRSRRGTRHRSPGRAGSTRAARRRRSLGTIAKSVDALRAESAATPTSLDAARRAAACRRARRRTRRARPARRRRRS